MSNRTPRTERTARTTMYDEELDKTMLPPQVTRITDKRSNHNNLSLNQTANMNRPYMQVTGLETVEYVSITRPAPMLTRNIQGRRHSGHDKQRRSQQRAGQHRSRTQHNRSDVEVGTRSTGSGAPPSHFTGSHPIVGTFATPGIVCTNSFLSAHGVGVGDHRLQLHDFCAISILGTEYPKTVRPSGRALRCDVPRIRKKYIKRLKKQIKRHKIEVKLNILNDHQMELSQEELERHLNKLDEEVVQQQLGSEKRCNKFYDGKIELSPEVGIVVRRGRLYRRILDFKHGKPMNHRTLKDACRKQAVLLPSQLTIGEVKDHIKICQARLKELEKTAPQEDREQHLQSCYVVARDKKREKAVRIIQKMMRKESNQRQWRRIRNTIHPQRGSAVARLTVKSNTGDETLYATREGVEHQASRAIADQSYKMRDCSRTSGTQRTLRPHVKS